MRRGFVAAAPCAVLTSWLAGCSAPPKLAASQGLFASGRLSLTLDGPPAQHLQAAFELTGTPQAGGLVLLHPLGGTVLEVNWQPNHASAQRGADVWHAPDVLQLTQQLLNTALPVQALFEWIQRKTTAYEGWQPLASHPNQPIVVQRLQPDAQAVLRIALDN